MNRNPRVADQTAKVQDNQVIDLLDSRGRSFDSYREFFHRAGHLRLPLRALIERILRRPDLLSRIAAQSYSHELSFDKMVLHRDADTGCVLRLHIWWSQPAEDEIDIHDHGRHFHSQVMLGSLRHSLWEIADQGEEFLNYRYAIDDQSLECSAQYCGPVFLKRVSVKSFCEGDSYSLRTIQLHSVIPESTSVAATFVVQGPLVTATSNFYKRPGTTSRRESTKQSFDNDGLERQLKNFVQLL